MKTCVSRTFSLGAFALTATLVACSKEEPPVARTAPTPVASAALAPSAAQKRFEVASGTATFLIDAPLEKIKGRSTKARGNIDVDLGDLKTGKGQIEFDLGDLKTETFGDPSKDGAQTEHAKNWFEIGADVEAKRREENRWARFTIKSVDDASPTKLAAAEAKTPLAVHASGDFWLHGATSPKKVNVTLTFEGPASAPTSLHVATAQPFSVSLQEHDVKPRDLAGKFVSGALEKIGQKIDDTVQVSFDITAKPK